MPIPSGKSRQIMVLEKWYDITWMQARKGRQPSAPAKASLAPAPGGRKYQPQSHFLVGQA